MRLTGNLPAVGSLPIDSRRKMAGCAFLCSSMIRYLLALMLALAVATVPTALAEEPKEDAAAPEEGEQAWVDDCPPDHMCAYSEPGENETYEEPTEGPDCGDVECAYDEAPQEYGEEDCIHCSGPTSGGDEGETHDPDTDYVQAPEGSENGITSVEEEQPAQRNPVPAPAAALAIAGGAIALVLLAARRK